MCHETHARPPLPPIAGGAGVGPAEKLILKSSDGTDFRAYSAQAAVPGGPGIAILPDVRGLHPFYRDLADRFAEIGVHAAVMDYFGRTAGTEDRDEDFDYMSHVQKTDPDNIAQDCSATIEHLRSESGGKAESVFTVGFCFGGRNSVNQAARRHGLRGVIGFYGRMTRIAEADTNAPIDRVDDFECPVLGFFGGADQGIPAEAVKSFGVALDSAGIGNELLVYDGAPHSFFDRSFDDHKAACDDAWRHMLDFLGIAPGVTAR